jgi:hypothetical protein
MDDYRLDQSEEKKERCDEKKDELEKIEQK